jgi:hypothetical protein
VEKSTVGNMKAVQKKSELLNLARKLPSDRPIFERLKILSNLGAGPRPDLRTRRW